MKNIKLTKAQCKKVSKLYLVSMAKHIKISSGYGSEVDECIKKNLEELSDSLTKDWKLKDQKTSIKQCIEEVLSNTKNTKKDSQENEQ